jgi:hypothetical protein
MAATLQCTLHRAAAAAADRADAAGRGRDRANRGVCGVQGWADEPGRDGAVAQVRAQPQRQRAGLPQEGGVPGHQGGGALCCHLC